MPYDSFYKTPAVSTIQQGSKIPIVFLFRAFLSVCHLSVSKCTNRPVSPSDAMKRSIEAKVTPSVEGRHIVRDQFHCIFVSDRHLERTIRNTVFEHPWFLSYIYSKFSITEKNSWLVSCMKRSFTYFSSQS